MTTKPVLADPVIVGYWRESLTDTSSSLPLPEATDIPVDVAFLAKLGRIIDTAASDVSDSAVGMEMLVYRTRRPCLLCNKVACAVDIRVTSGSARYLFPSLERHYYAAHNVQPPAHFVKFIMDFEIVIRPAAPDRKVAPPRPVSGSPWFPSVFSDTFIEDKKMAEYGVFKLEGADPVKMKINVWDIVTDLVQINEVSKLFRPINEDDADAVSSGRKKHSVLEPSRRRSDFAEYVTAKLKEALRTK